MAAREKSDQIFQLSLTEIAFTLVFILLLLLGYLVYKEQSDKVAAQAALAEIRETVARSQSLVAAREALSGALSSAGAKREDLDAVISRLSEAQAATSEKNRLAKKVEDLDAKISAMTELQEVMTSSPAGKEAGLEEVASALALQNEVRKSLETTKVPRDGEPGESFKPKPANAEEVLDEVRQAVTTSKLLKSNLKEQLDLSLTKGQEQNTIREVVAAARAYAQSAKGGASLEATRKENSDLRGQVAFFKRRLEARGGRDFPPCWATESGSPEFLLSVELTPAGVMVQPAWPARREADARALPGIDLALQSSVSLDVFVRNIQGIFNGSKVADPQCRHYVFLKSTLAEAVASDRARLTVENYFYKSEARR